MSGTTVLLWSVAVSLAMWFGIAWSVVAAVGAAS